MANDGAPIERLRDLRKRGRLIPFVGAGVSQPLGLPSTEDLIGMIAAKMGFDPDVFKMHGSLLQLAEYGELQSGQIGHIRQLMSESFHTKDANERRAASRLHETLACAGLSRIYTTNYDEHIERAFGDQKKSVITVATLADLQQDRAPGSTQVIKFHGSLENDKSLVLTESSYFRRLRFDQPLDLLLLADSLENGFLFMGYGFRDPNIRLIWHNLKVMWDAVTHDMSAKPERIPSAVAGVGFGEVHQRILRHWGIEVIDLDPGDPDRDLEELVVHLFS